MTHMLVYMPRRLYIGLYLVILDNDGMSLMPVKYITLYMYQDSNVGCFGTSHMPVDMYIHI